MPTDVLLVDDERQILTILQETLSTAGFRVTACESGKAALGALADHQPDLMVTDLKMPGMSGLELLKEVRELTPDTQVVILTGFGDMNSAIEALRLGAYDYLQKPVDAERLIQTLRNGTERRRLILENRALVQSLQEANQLKTEFINGMSHEIRTPLGHITGFAQILEGTLDRLTEKQARYLQNIQTAANRLLSMFDNILQYSVLNSGEVQIAPASFPLSEFLNRTLDPFESAVAEKRIAVDLQPPEPDRSVIADAETCRKILSLLLDNAVQFSPEQGALGLKAEVLPSPSVPSDLDERGAEAWLHISVSDTGPGIDPEDQERIFNLFEQVDGSLAREHEGTGLGLALARSLARIHNGVIALDSRPGEGSTFTLVIPLPEG